MRSTIAAVVATILFAASASAETFTLSDALDRAAKLNPALKTSAYDQRIAAENVTIAKSGYLPRVDFRGGYTVQKDPQAVILNGMTVPEQDRTYGSFSLALNQNIYDFGRRKSQVDRALLTQQSVASSYAGQRQDVFLSVVSDYYTVIRAGKFRDAAQEEVREMEDHLKMAQSRFAEGVVTRNDVLQAEVRLANSRQTLLSRQNDVENAWLVLNYATGQPASFRADLKEQPGEVSLLKDQEFMDRINANRPDVAALQKLVQASEVGVTAAKSDYYPEIYGTLGIDYQENSKVKKQAIYSAGVGLKMNLFEGGATTARLRQAVLERSQNEERLRELKEQVYLEYRSAWNDMSVAKDRVQVTQDAIRQSEENLRINKERYKEGVGTATDVLDAQTLLTQTVTEYHRAVTDYDVAVARVRKALGEI